MAATMTVSPEALALVQSEANGKMALLRQHNGHLVKINEAQGAHIARMSGGEQTTGGRILMGASTLTTVTAAVIGGAAHGYLTSKDSHKMGPWAVMSVVGLATAAGGVAINHAGAGELISAVSRGLVAGPMWQASFNWAQQKSAAAQVQAAQQPAQQQPAAATGKRAA